MNHTAFAGMPGEREREGEWRAREGRFLVLKSVKEREKESAQRRAAGAFALWGSFLSSLASGIVGYVLLIAQDGRRESSTPGMFQVHNI